MDNGRTYDPLVLLHWAGWPAALPERFYLELLWIFLLVSVLLLRGIFFLETQGPTNGKPFSVVCR